MAAGGWVVTIALILAVGMTVENAKTKESGFLEFLILYACAIVGAGCSLIVRQAMGYWTIVVFLLVWALSFELMALIGAVLNRQGRRTGA